MVEMKNNVGLPPPPLWLKVLLTKKFYTDDNKCRTHDRQFETCFCKKCMDECFCHKCLNNSAHKDHDIVRVFKASGKPSMCTDDLNNIWATGKIQLFKFNGKNVIYLHERKQNYVKHGCRMCNTSLLDAIKYDFCSIECQMKYYIDISNVTRYIEDNDAPRNTLHNSDFEGLSSANTRAIRPLMPQRRCLKPHRVSTTTVKPQCNVQEQLNAQEQLAEEVNKAVSKRRHRRKGIPRRAASPRNTSDQILYFPWRFDHCSSPLKTQHSPVRTCISHTRDQNR